MLGKSLGELLQVGSNYVVDDGDEGNYLIEGSSIQPQRQLLGKNNYRLINTK